jgi:uncharacterized protein with PIN domain
VKFICDDNLGKLAKYLRVLGYDTLFKSEIEDGEILRIALSEKRIILTRDSKLKALRSAERVILIKFYDPAEQLQQVFGELELKPQGNKTFTRCLDCNTELVEIPKEKCAGRIPPYIFKTQERFLHCESCDKIFWAGTHVERLSEKLKRFLPD